MRKLLSFCIFFSGLFGLNSAYSAGSVTHFYIATEIIPKMESPELQSILTNYIDAYKAGAGYPDSGYVVSDTYGEISHWDPFIFALADYMRETYPDPIKTNPKLVAFLMGVATHSISDIGWHWGFIPQLGQHDFNGDRKKGHDNADIGLDIMLLVDKNLWTEHPLVWWIPVDDLVKVYERMGVNFSKEDIIAKNAVYYLTGIGERLIGLPASQIYKWKMPWGKNNYLTQPDSGIYALEEKCAIYNNHLWNRLIDSKENSSIFKGPLPPTNLSIHSKIDKDSFIHSTSNNAIKDNIAEAKTKYTENGVELEISVDTKKFKSMLSEAMR